MPNVESAKAYPKPSWYTSVLGPGLTTDADTIIRWGARANMIRRPRHSVIYICPTLNIDHSSKEQILKQYEQDLGDVRITMISRFQELIPLIDSPEFEFNWVTIDLEHLSQTHGVNIFDLVRTIHILLQTSVCNGRSRSTCIVGVVGDTTDPTIIREAMAIPEICTLCIREGGAISHEQALADAKRFLSGDMTIPQIIKDRVNTRKSRNKKEGNFLRLTPRQTQILDLVSTRGASNKVIARTLKISESTVKLHISAILKKYGCRNRTQLVVFSKQERDKQEA